jgi:hypothetical protein
MVVIALLVATTGSFAGTILPPDAAAAAPALKYLADAPFPYVQGYTGNYGNNFSTFTQNLTDQGLNIGTIGFEYNTFAASTAAGGKVPDASFVGGAALSGIFTAAPNVTVPAGDRVAWVQVITTNQPGDGNVWGATANQPYPDTGGSAASPNYPYQYTWRSNQTPPAQPSAGFMDAPSRAPSASLVTNWQAELGLALEDPTKHVATILGTFTWGFIEQAVAQNTATLANVLPITPYSSNQDGGGPLTPPSPGFLSTLTADFDGKMHGTVTSTQWTFDNSQHFMAAANPEPTSLIMAAQVVLFGLGHARWRRQRAAQTEAAARAGG